MRVRSLLFSSKRPLPWCAWRSATHCPRDEVTARRSSSRGPPSGRPQSVGAPVSSDTSVCRALVEWKGASSRADPPKQQTTNSKTLPKKKHKQSPNSKPNHHQPTKLEIHGASFPSGEDRPPIGRNWSPARLPRAAPRQRLATISIVTRNDESRRDVDEFDRPSRAWWMIGIDESWSGCPNRLHHRPEAQRGYLEQPVLRARGAPRRCIVGARPGGCLLPPTLSRARVRLRVLVGGAGVLTTSTFVTGRAVKRGPHVGKRLGHGKEGRRLRRQEGQMSGFVLSGNAERTAPQRHAAALRRARALVPPRGGASWRTGTAPAPRRSRTAASTARRAASPS